MLKLRFTAIFAGILAFSSFFPLWAAAAADLGGKNIVGLSGRVTEIAPYTSPDGTPSETRSFLYMELLDTEGGLANTVSFYIDESTELIGGVKPAAGSIIKAYYDSSLPVILIYPPRYTAVAIEVLSAQEHPPENAGITVNGEKLDAPALFTENGVVMVPLRPICEKLGYELNWNADRKQVEIGSAISLTIGENGYIFARRAPFELSAAPVIRDSSTFVPLEFFGVVVPGVTAEYKDGGVHIDTVSA